MDDQVVALLGEFLVACGKYDTQTRRSQPNVSRAVRLYSELSPDLVNSADEDGWTALHHACGEGALSVVEWLTESTPADINKLDTTNCTPLWVAAFNNRRDCVKHLLRLGANEAIKGAPEGEPISSPALAARRNRHPGLADLIEAETSLRNSDPCRLLRQMSGEMTVEEFRDSMRGLLKPSEL